METDDFQNFFWFLQPLVWFQVNLCTQNFYSRILVSTTYLVPGTDIQRFKPVALYAPHIPRVCLKTSGLFER